MVLQLGIAKPLVASKNTFKNKNQNSGYSSEQAVIYLLKKQGWLLEFQRLKTKIAEIDLVFSKENKILIIEVKRLNAEWRSFERIQVKQIQKLQKNLIYLTYLIPSFQINAFVCWVDMKNKISFVSLS